MGRYVVDIDMTVANNEERAKVLSRQDIPSSQRWGMFFEPNGVMKDAFMPEAAVLNRLLQEGHDVVFMTGRPERTRDATVNWLSQHFSGYSPEAHALYMKQDGNFNATSGWKANKLKELFGADDDFTFIDDDDNNRRVVSEAFPVATVLHPDGGWKQIEDGMTESYEAPSAEAPEEVDSKSDDEVYDEF